MTNRTLIIAEAGVNHNGDIGLARQLVDVAAEKNQAPLSMWIEKESGKVARAGTYTANEKM